MEATSRHSATVIDSKLLSRVAKGDLEAFELLYDQSSVLLFTLALRILGSREEASQLLQSVYLEVWRKVARYDMNRGTPIAWLLTLTRSRAIERLRSAASNESSASALSLDPSPLGEARSPETKDDEDLRHTIAAALAELPAPQREAVEKAYYQGLSHTEIATKLDQPPGTVRTRMKLAMLKLRAALYTTLEQIHP